MLEKNRPAWQLPKGVPVGAWDYVHDPAIAVQYDQFHAGHPLLQLDRELIDQSLGSEWRRSDGSPKIAIDFGCGTGRNLIPLAERGWRTIGVDLSLSMLREFQKKAISRGLLDSMHFVLANMASTVFFQSEFADAVLCMYSSIGMVQGRKNRRAFLESVSRILRPQGLFFIHVHNRGLWLSDPGGIRKTLTEWARSKVDSVWELGDRVYAYRGLPSMYLHIFSERELRQDLKACGLKIRSFHRLNHRSDGYLRSRWLPHVRSGGFIAVCFAKERTP